MPGSSLSRRRHAHTHRPSRLSLGGTLEGGAGSLEAAAEGSALDPDIDLERPPSPKYDERVDFFFPAAKPRQRRAARRQGGPDTGAGFARRGAAGVAYGADWPRKRLRMSQVREKVLKALRCAAFLVPAQSQLPTSCSLASLCVSLACPGALTTVAQAGRGELSGRAWGRIRRE